MSKIKFKRVELGKGGTSTKFSFLQSEATRAGEVVEKDYKPVTVNQGAHDDLKNTFVKMTPHLLFSLELAKAKILRPEWFNEYKFLDDERFDGINVFAVDIMEKEDVYKVRLYGTKTTSNGEVCSINSPWIDLFDGSPERYPLQTVISDNLEELLKEASLFWSNQKYAPTPQQSLELI